MFSVLPLKAPQANSRTAANCNTIRSTHRPALWPARFNACSARQSATIRRLQRLCPRTLCKEVVMFRKTMIALATVAALGALTPTAADARGGFGGGFHGGGFHGGGFGGGFRGGGFHGV